MMNNKLFSFLLGNIGVFGIRFLYFIVLTFTLSIQEIASFTTNISISSIILCLCTYGSYNLFMRRSAKGEDGKKIIGEYISSSFILLILTIILISIFFSFLNTSIELYDLILILIAEYSFTAIPGIFKSYALSEYDRSIFIDSITNIISSCLLLLASLFLLFFHMKIEDTYSSWINTYLIISIFSFLFRIFIWKDKLVLPSISSLPKIIITQMKSGHNFMISSVFRNSYLNIDKILIYSLLGKEIAGLYAISFRFFNVFLMLLNSISGVKEAILYQLAEESKLKLKHEFKVIQHSTIKYFLYSIPLWLIISIGIFNYYPITCFYMFLSLFFLCPIQLLSLSKLNLLNSISLENHRLILMLAGFIFNIVISFSLYNYLSWLAIIIGLLTSSLTILIPGHYLFKNKYLNNK
ncbi:oligosaccharide flippase family protein [Providencia rettgeri]|nr:MULTISPECIES: oligosaccharide flippase family protein [unclassified Providencia]MDB9566426.1 oligosaccharide flippase family protein [Providencia rettgeri]WIE08189.1 oligosaccharide flippase family protein [Providencia rettgeri]WOB90935.1 oligosaccharide flippase family protein [Providencia sp. PROV175]